MARKPHATLITGGSNGIGAAIVQARSDLGEVVVNLDVVAPTGPSAAQFVAVDLSDATQLHAALDTLTTQFAITRLVNCAGVALLSPIASFNEDAFQRTMEVNVRAPAIIAKAVIPAMKAAKFGRIVNIASRAALGKELRTSYAGSKGALISATRVWALELGAYGITVNAIGPGPIETDLFRHANPPESERTQKLVANIPVGRMGQPSDVSGAADFFLNDKTGFVTGQVLYVCGGMTVGDAGN